MARRRLNVAAAHEIIAARPVGSMTGSMREASAWTLMTSPWPWNSHGWVFSTEGARIAEPTRCLASSSDRLPAVMTGSSPSQHPSVGADSFGGGEPIPSWRRWVLRPAPSTSLSGHRHLRRLTGGCQYPVFRSRPPVDRDQGPDHGHRWTVIGLACHRAIRSWPGRSGPGPYDPALGTHSPVQCA